MVNINISNLSEVNSNTEIVSRFWFYRMGVNKLNCQQYFFKVYKSWTSHTESIFFKSSCFVIQFLSQTENVVIK